jgi:hypothetical protein
VEKEGEKDEEKEGEEDEEDAEDTKENRLDAVPFRVVEGPMKG